jgi:hypothetical protein
VTGASAGIGYAIANELARCGMKVIGCLPILELILITYSQYQQLRYGEGKFFGQLSCNGLCLQQYA